MISPGSKSDRGADILLKRYPNHLQWPRLAEKSARYHHQNRRYEQSKRIYLHLMDRSEASELSHMLKLIKAHTAYDPAGTPNWILLANTCEWSGDTSGTINALEGAVSADPINFRVKLRLAMAYAGRKHYEKAEHILSQIDPAQVRYDADYQFCLVTLAEWMGNSDQALNYYAAAIKMRHYKPIYHCSACRPDFFDLDAGDL
jgi:tetratricopeptide (TPR) repeat protein